MLLCLNDDGRAKTLSTRTASNPSKKIAPVPIELSSHDESIADEPPGNVAPMSGVIHDVPDSFFSDDDFEIPPVTRAALPKPASKRETAPLGSTFSPLSFSVQSHESIPKTATSHDLYKEQLHESSSHPSGPIIMPSLTYPSRLERVVPQASRADLMAEKGRISMEICDLMDLVELGTASQEQKSKLNELKCRRYTWVNALEKCTI